VIFRRPGAGPKQRPVADDPIRPSR
jgi:hypothetical protein